MTHQLTYDACFHTPACGCGFTVPHPGRHPSYCDRRNSQGTVSGDDKNGKAIVEFSHVQTLMFKLRTTKLYFHAYYLKFLPTGLTVCLTFPVHSSPSSSRCPPRSQKAPSHILSKARYRTMKFTSLATTPARPTQIHCCIPRQHQYPRSSKILQIGPGTTIASPTIAH